MPKNKHRGSNFEDFLAEEGMLETVKAAALKRSIALQLQRLIAEQEMSKTELAERMKTSRAALDRLLDAENPSLTLTTLEKVAQALGRRLQIEFVPA
jgi:DNA-binding Xre family transcriptional regulator